jgi:hypothetical protein
MRLTALLICVLTACGTAGPTVEEITRDNLAEWRAQAVALRVQPCIAACDRAIAVLDAGGTIRDLGWHDHIVAIHAACDKPLGLR